MQDELANDTQRFFNKYVEARYHASLKREIYSERKVKLRE